MFTFTNTGTVSTNLMTVYVDDNCSNARYHRTGKLEFLQKDVNVNEKVLFDVYNKN